MSRLGTTSGWTTLGASPFTGLKTILRGGDPWPFGTILRGKDYPDSKAMVVAGQRVVILHEPRSPEWTGLMTTANTFNWEEDS